MCRERFREIFFVKENNQPLKDDRFSSKQKLSCICRHICTCVYMYMNRSVDVGYVWVGFHDAYMSSMFARKYVALQRLIVFFLQRSVLQNCARHTDPIQYVQNT